MAQLLVRNLEDEVAAALKKRAARHQRSVEAEHRAILRAALAHGPGPQTLKELLRSMPAAGEDSDFLRRREKPGRRRG